MHSKIELKAQRHLSLPTDCLLHIENHTSINIVIILKILEQGALWFNLVESHVGTMYQKEIALLDLGVIVQSDVILLIVRKVETCSNFKIQPRTLLIQGSSQTPAIHFSLGFSSGSIA